MTNLYGKGVVSVVRNSNPLIWFQDSAFRRLFKNAGVLLSGNVGASVLGLVSTALTARALGPETFGILALITTYTLVVDKLVNFQSWQGIIKYGADALENDRREDFASLLKFGFLLDGGTALLGTTVAAGGAWIVGNYRGWDSEVVVFATLYSATILFHVSGTPTAILRLFDKFKLFSFQMVIAATVKLLGVGVAFLTGTGFRAFLLVWAVTDIVGKALLVTFAIVQLKKTQYWEPVIRAKDEYKRRFKGLWSFVLMTNLNSSIRMASREVDVLIVGGILTPEAAGLFKVAKQIAGLLLRLTDPLYQSIYPELAKLRASASTRHLVRFAGKSSVIVGIGAIIAWLVAVIIGEWVIVAIFGSSYSPAYAILVWYMIAIVIAVFALPLQPMMLSLGQPQRTFWIHLGATIIYFSLLFILTRAGSALGAAQAYIGYYLAWALGMIGSIGLHLRAEAKGKKLSGMKS